MHCGGERRASKHFGRTRCAYCIPTVRAATSCCRGEPCMTGSRPIDAERLAVHRGLSKHCLTHRRIKHNGSRESLEEVTQVCSVGGIAQQGSHTENLLYSTQC